MFLFDNECINIRIKYHCGNIYGYEA